MTRRTMVMTASIFSFLLCCSIIYHLVYAESVSLSSIVSPGGGRNSLDASDGDPLDAVYVDADGDVGIGTTSPSRRFHIFEPNTGSRTDVFAKVQSANGVGALELESSDGFGTFIDIMENGVSKGGVQIDGGTAPAIMTLTVNRTGASSNRIDLVTGVTTTLSAKDGKVGIGNTTAQNTLSVGNDIIGVLDPKTITVGNTTGNSSIAFGQGNPNFAYLRWNYNATPANAYVSFQAGNSQAIAIAPAGGNVGIGTTDPQAKLDVAGNIRANLNSISGGVAMKYFNGVGGPNPRELGHDIAELFDTSEEVEVGDLLVIDENSDIKLKKSRVPYDTHVAGVVSWAPAILFQGSQLEIAPTPGGFSKGAKPPVTLAGRVLCKVTTQNGAIERGDLLTSSSVAGHAMKATDREKSFGAIVGKALESFQGGPNGEKTGRVMVIVALQ